MDYDENESIIESGELDQDDILADEDIPIYKNLRSQIEEQEYPY